MNPNNPYGHCGPEHHDDPMSMTRRDMLKRCGMGLGMIGLTSLLQQQGLLTAANPLGESALSPMAPKLPHFTPKAKRVIWLFINGGPSHMDTWEYKPDLGKYHGKELEGFDKNTGFFTKEVGAIMRSPFKFSQRGQSGKWSLKFSHTWVSTWTKWGLFTRFIRNRIIIHLLCS